MVFLIIKLTTRYKLEKWSTNFRQEFVFKKGWVGRNVIAEHQAFLEWEKNLGWEASLEPIWSNLLLKGYPCQAEAGIFPARKIPPLFCNLLQYCFNLQWTGFLFQTNISPEATEVHSLLSSIISVLTFWYWKFGIGFSLHLLCSWTDKNSFILPSQPKLSQSLVVLVSLCCTFSIFYCLFETGDQSWTEHSRCGLTRVKWVGMITFPNFCGRSLADVAQGAVSSLAWQGVFLVMVIIQRNPKVKPNSQQQRPRTYVLQGASRPALGDIAFPSLWKKSNLSL